MPDRTGDADLGRRIQEARRRAGLTQQQLAERIARSQPWVGHVEVGRRNPAVQDVAEIARVLGVTTDALLVGGPPVAAGLTAEEAQAVEALRSMPAYARRAALRSVLAIAEEAGDYRAGEDPPAGRQSRP